QRRSYARGQPRAGRGERPAGGRSCRRLQLNELRNSSTESAVRVCSFALPRAPSATDTRAIVSASGASTTLMKSNGPSVAHWCKTLAPSSSTSRLTSRRRSGFAFSVCTPCAVRLDSMMYVGIAPPRRVSRRLVEVEQRGAEEEYGRDHEQRQEGGRRALDLTGAAAQEEEHGRGKESDDDEQRERHRRR